MLSHRSCSLIVLVVAVLLGSAVGAAEPETADQLVAKGVELRKKGDHAGALREFQAAHAIEPSGRTLAQMGIAEATLQRWTEADEHLEQALGSPGFWVEKNRITLQQTLQTVRTHTSEVSIKGPSGAVVTIGDKVVGQIPLPAILRVREGAVAVKVESPGYKPFSQIIVAGGGTRVIVTATLDPLAPDRAVPVPPAAHETESLLGHDTSSGPRSWRRWTGIGALTVGLVAVTWGIVWIAVDGHSSWSTSQRVWDTRTPGWFIAGGGVAASLGGGYLLYSSRSSEVQVAATPTGLMGRF
jgi:PEGA domain-containing protein